MSIRVVLVDDEAMIRAGLRMVLETAGGIEVVGEAADGREAIAEVERLRPDVALMDIRMPTLDGLAAAEQILESNDEVRIVILTTFDEDPYLHEALRIGASGFLLKVAPPERLIEGVRVAAAGDALLDPLVTRRVIASFTRRVPQRDSGGGAEASTPARLELLTARELEVLHHLAHGSTNAEIAAELVVGESTVKTHVARVLMKLHLRDRIQAVVFAYQHGLVDRGEDGAPAR